MRTGQNCTNSKSHKGTKLHGAKMDRRYFCTKINFNKAQNCTKGHNKMRKKKKKNNFKKSYWPRVRVNSDSINKSKKS